MLDAITPDDLRAVVAKLVQKAKAGNLAAIREVLDRTLGKSPAAIAVGFIPPALKGDEQGNDDHKTVEGRRNELLTIIETVQRRERAARCGT